MLQDYRFLSGYVQPFQPQSSQPSDLAMIDQRLQQQVIKEHAAAKDQEFPLTRLQKSGLTIDHLQALLFAGLVEIDARFGTVYSVLHPFPEEQRLTVGLLEDLMQFNRNCQSPSIWALVQTLERRGLVDRHNCDRPRAAQSLTVPSLIWDALSGFDSGSAPGPDQTQLTESLSYLPFKTLKSFETLSGLLPSELLLRLARLPELIKTGLVKGVVLRGLRGTGRLWAISAVAQSRGYNLLHLKRPNIKELPALCRLTGTLATLKKAIPVVELELTPGENLALPVLSGYDQLFGILLNNEGSLSGPQAENCLSIKVPVPNRSARAQQWTQVLEVTNDDSSSLVDQASQYHLTLGSVTRVGQLAQAYATLNSHPHVQLSDIQEACRALSQQTLENLATHIATHDCDWETLIVSQKTRVELDILLRRCQYRETLLDHLGAGFAGTKRGVRAMFSGPSGTGKTLAARIIAIALGLELYRVDLSSVVSKYIGETERNLSQLFSRAEEQDVVLLLDEGDSLLTERTDVQSANDRYANMETNYLLQRLEQYDGIILITTNAASRIDSAFQRRIDIIVEFGLPDAEQREKLWQLHLPKQHNVSELVIQQAALQCQLSGGQIRNAALHATLRSLESEDLLSEACLIEGIQREYTKMGAASPLN